MVEEAQQPQETKQTEEAPKEIPRQKTIVDEAREERIKLEQLKQDLQKQIEELRTLRAEDALGGRTEVSDSKPKEVDPKEYATGLLKNRL